MKSLLLFQSLIAKGLTAQEWVSKVCEKVGGKGGGKDQQAQAVGNNPDAIKDACELAKQFAKIKIAVS